MFFQTPAQPEPLLDRIVANVARYHATLPSITADESIKSDLSQHGLYRAHGTASATIRVAAGKPGEELTESRTYLTLDGKPVSPDKKAIVPFELTGAFSRILDVFFSAANVKCFLFQAPSKPAADGTVEIDFSTLPIPPAGCSKEGATLAGEARVDPSNAEVVHVERTLLTIPPAWKHATTFIGVDFSPAHVGAETYWLPSLLTAELDHGKGHFEARYSNFHRYTGSIKILPGETPVNDGAPQ